MLHGELSHLFDSNQGASPWSHLGLVYGCRWSATEVCLLTAFSQITGMLQIRSTVLDEARPKSKNTNWDLYCWKIQLVLPCPQGWFCSPCRHDRWVRRSLPFCMQSYSWQLLSARYWETILVDHGTITIWVVIRWLFNMSRRNGTTADWKSSAKVWMVAKNWTFSSQDIPKLLLEVTFHYN